MSVGQSAAIRIDATQAALRFNCYTAGDFTLLDLVGPVEVRTVAELRGELRRILATAPGLLWLDVRDATFLDPTGPAALTAAAYLLRRRRGRMMIVGASAAARRMLLRAGLASLLDAVGPADPDRQTQPSVAAQPDCGGAAGSNSG